MRRSRFAQATPAPRPRTPGSTRACSRTKSATATSGSRSPLKPPTATTPGPSPAANAVHSPKPPPGTTDQHQHVARDHVGDREHAVVVAVAATQRQRSGARAGREPGLRADRSTRAAGARPAHQRPRSPARHLPLSRDTRPHPAPSASRPASSDRAEPQDIRNNWRISRPPAIAPPSSGHPDDGPAHARPGRATAAHLKNRCFSIKPAASGVRIDPRLTTPLDDERLRRSRVLLLDASRSGAGPDRALAGYWISSNSALPQWPPRLLLVPRTGSAPHGIGSSRSAAANRAKREPVDHASGARNKSVSGPGEPDQYSPRGPDHGDADPLHDRLRWGHGLGTSS